MSTPLRNLPSPSQFSAPRIIEVATSLQPAAHTTPPGQEPPKGKGPARTRRFLTAALVALAAVGTVNWAARELRSGRDSKPSVVSGKASLKHSQSDKFQRWRKQNLSVKIDSSVDKIGPRARSSIRQAFTSWQSAGITLPNVTFETTKGAKLSSAPDGVSTILFAPIDIPGHTNDLAVTIAFSDPSSGEIVEADIIINSKHDFATLQPDDTVNDDDIDQTDNDSSGKDGSKTTASSKVCVTHSDGARCGRKYDVQNVMTHEFGHFFGLAEDVDVRTATMYQCISACETHKRVLSRDDQEAVTELYAEGFSADQQPAAAGCSGAHVTPSTRTGFAGFGGALMTVLGFAALRRRSSAAR